MRFMSQTVRPLENASFKTNDPRRPWRVMVLSDTYRDAIVSISPVVWSENPGAAKALLNA